MEKKKYTIYYAYRSGNGNEYSTAETLAEVGQIIADAIDYDFDNDNENQSCKYWVKQNF